MHLFNHSNRYFVNIFVKIIRQNVKIEYIESFRFLISKNHHSINEVFDIFTVDVNKQLTIDRFVVLFFLLLNVYICFSLNLMSKFDDD